MERYDDVFLQQITDAAEQTAHALYRNDVAAAQQEIGPVLEAAGEIYRYMAANAAAYAAKGVAVPVEVLCAQLENLGDAVSNQDFLALADTLLYEIKEGLLFYREVKDILTE